MNKTYIKYLNENLGIIDSATSAYDNTDQEEVPSDVFLDPNAPALNLYANGDAFKMNDEIYIVFVIALLTASIIMHTDSRKKLTLCQKQIEVIQNDKRTY